MDAERGVSPAGLGVGHGCAKCAEGVTQRRTRWTSLCTLVRQLRGTHLRIRAWCVHRSSSDVTAAGSTSSLPLSSTSRFNVRSVEARL